MARINTHRTSTPRLALFALAVLAVGRRVDWEHAFRRAWRTMVRGFDRGTAQVAALGDAMPGAGEGRPPVLLVGGYANDERSVSAIRRSLDRDGFATFTMTMPDFGMGDIREHGALVRARVAEVRRLTGADVVDVVGYSSGGFAARVAAQLGDEGHGIGRVVTIATGNGGLDFRILQRVVSRWSPYGMRQVLRGSDLIRDLHDSRMRADVVSIGTGGLDGLVPNPLAYRIEGRPFVAVDHGRRFGPFSRVTHAAIVRDRVTYESVRDALLATR